MLQCGVAVRKKRNAVTARDLSDEGSLVISVRDDGALRERCGGDDNGKSLEVGDEDTAAIIEAIPVLSDHAARARFPIDDSLQDRAVDRLASPIEHSAACLNVHARRAGKGVGQR